MSYKIPDDDKLAEAIFVVMYRNQQVKSQSEMIAMVRMELSKSDENYRVSGERIRRVAINRKMLQLVIEYNKSNTIDLPDICPVCKNPLSSVMNTTLDGNTIEVNRKCTACPYSIGVKKHTPGRYTFIRKSRK
ncbi:MAG: hypothetical protein WC248_04345 [Candidatus Methanomethylophilaceae archaeon]|jgi:uncharacterized protein with PIN domain